MLTDTELRNRQSNHNCYAVNSRHGLYLGLGANVCLALYVAVTIRCVTRLKQCCAIHRRRETITCTPIQKITGQNAPVDTIKNRSVQYPERHQHPNLFNRAPRNHQGYTTYPSTN